MQYVVASSVQSELQSQAANIDAGLTTEESYTSLTTVFNQLPSLRYICSNNPASSKLITVAIVQAAVVI